MNKKRQCRNKEKFDTRDEALKTALIVSRKKGSFFTSYRVYKCDYCKYYHFGHRPGWGKKIR